MNIFKATADFEHWLAGQLPIIRQDLSLKHQHMAEAAFPFFRAAFGSAKDLSSFLTVQLQFRWPKTVLRVSRF